MARRGRRVSENTESACRFRIGNADVRPACDNITAARRLPVPTHAESVKNKTVHDGLSGVEEAGGEVAAGVGEVGVVRVLLAPSRGREEAARRAGEVEALIGARLLLLGVPAPRLHAHAEHLVGLLVCFAPGASAGNGAAETASARVPRRSGLLNAVILVALEFGLDVVRSGPDSMRSTSLERHHHPEQSHGRDCTHLGPMAVLRNRLGVA